MAVYRLEAQRAGAVSHLFPRPFASVVEACDYAERVIDQLADHFGWRVRSFRVLEMPSYRTVTEVIWHDPAYDPDPFAASPAVEPPAAPPLPVWDTAGPGEGGKPQAGPQIPSQVDEGRPGGGLEAD